MGSVSGGALAAAVLNAGGLGLIGAGYGNADWIRREFDRAAGARIGIGFITWSLARQPQLLDLALGYKPCAVMLSFGDPRPFAESVRASGAKLICQVQSLAIARQALEARPDVIVAQGAEAGGHGGERSLFALLPAVRDLAGDKPILAAGGIADRRGYEAALALGADGVLVGTRFIASGESLSTSAAKQRVVQANGDATVRTTVFDIVRGYDGWNGITGRALRNRFTATWHGKEAALRERIDAERKTYNAAVERQDYDTGVIFAGEAVDLIDEILPAAEIVRRITP
jgi:nitronate monooxygenase